MAILGKNSHFLTQILTNKKKLFFVDYAPGHFWQYQFVLTFFKSSVFLIFFKKRQAVDSILQFGKRALFIGILTS